ncbi:hypothetical protein CDAR_614261 [Caerostris darwini]|uniref:Uncharacterized protein n=1 Tax=Caerostris darwini TaxID=1538125 RepID=A0AAV4MD67_9ARAC|nr:hypothetical protein CDAR_614261 [Caerostris darwini]
MKYNQNLGSGIDILVVTFRVCSHMMPKYETTLNVFPGDINTPLPASNCLWKRNFDHPSEFQFLEEFNIRRGGGGKAIESEWSRKFGFYARFEFRWSGFSNHVSRGRNATSGELGVPSQKYLTFVVCVAAVPRRKYLKK